MQPQPAVVALLDHVDARAPEIAAAMAEAILAEVEPMKAVSRNDPNFRPRFEAFCEQHVRTFIQTHARDAPREPRTSSSCAKWRCDARRMHSRCPS